MANKSLVTGHGSSRWTRRAFLASSTLAVVALAGCGDESSTRQFAGRPQTPGNEGSPGATGVVGSPGSPTALPTQMPVSELLAPRGIALNIPVVQQHRISLVNISSGALIEIWADRDRTIWAAAADPTGERIAVLSSPNGEVAGWVVDFVASDGTALGHVELGNRKGTPEPKPDAVAAGLGGIAWIADTASAAVSLPTGGLQQVYADGSHVRLLSAASAKRPAAVAVTPDAGTIAFVN